MGGHVSYIYIIKGVVRLQMSKLGNIIFVRVIHRIRRVYFVKQIVFGFIMVN